MFTGCYSCLFFYFHSVLNNQILEKIFLCWVVYPCFMSVLSFFFFWLKFSFFFLFFTFFYICILFFFVKWGYCFDSIQSTVHFHLCIFLVFFLLHFQGCFPNSCSGLPLLSLILIIILKAYIRVPKK